MQSCNGLLGWLFGHRFRPRYTDVSKVRTLVDWCHGIQAAKVYAINLENLADKLKDDIRTYECDVCTRCGAVTKREE